MIHLAGVDDRPALEHLAALDSATLPEGPALLALVEGEPVAALPLDGSRPVADPFRPTAAIVRLLAVRASQLEGGRRRTRLAGLRPRPRPA